MMLIAKSKRSKAVNTHLWPYELIHAVNIANIFPKEINDVSSLGKFSRTSIRQQLKMLHMFGYPVYALDTRLHQRIPSQNGIHTVAPAFTSALPRDTFVLYPSYSI